MTLSCTAGNLGFDFDVFDLATEPFCNTIPAGKIAREDIGLISRGMVDTVVEPERAHLVRDRDEVRKAESDWTEEVAISGRLKHDQHCRHRKGTSILGSRRYEERAKVKRSQILRHEFRPTHGAALVKE